MIEDTEILDKLYLEWSQFTKAETAKEMRLRRALLDIAESNPNKFDDPVQHANWCIMHAESALSLQADARSPSGSER